MAGTPGRRTVLAAGFAFLAAAIGLATLGVALNTRAWDELEAVAIPLLIVGVALAVGWACVLGIGLLGDRPWARWWSLLTFLAVSAASGMALFDTVDQVTGGGTTPVRHLIAPASLFTVATSIVLLLAFAGERDRS
jgi:hypothetical protein